MKPEKTYENFPVRMVIICNAVPLATCVLGVYILSGFGLWFVALYLLFWIALEIRLLVTGCRDCDYYGRLCGFGKGRICSWFFKKGQPEKFNKRTISAKDLIPDFMVGVIPMVAGIILLIRHFSWPVAAAIFCLIVLSFAGQAYIGGSFSCKYCAQRALGCPAEKFFQKKQKAKP